MRRYTVCLVALLGLQIGFWWHSKSIRPDLGIVPTPPSATTVNAMSLGDEAFYFRLFALWIQNSGDTFGRFTALRFYDFSKLYQWFTLLDGLEARSDVMPTLAAYYFSQTQNTVDNAYLVDYLYTHAMRDIAHKWWWLIQAMYIAQHKLDNKDLALKVGIPLVDSRVPVWAQTLTAVLYEKRGEMDDALRIIETIHRHSKEISDTDLKFMRYFVEERLKKMDSFTRDMQHSPQDSIHE